MIGEKEAKGNRPLGLQTEADREDTPVLAGLIRMYDSKGVFIGLFYYDSANNSWKPKKMFYGG